MDSSKCLPDTPLVDFIHGIKWSSYLGVIQGEYPDNALFHSLVKDSHQPDGEFSYTTPNYMGGQNVTLSWCKQPESNSIALYVYQVKPPTLLEE